MSASIPKTGKAWTIEGSDGFDSLKLNNEAPVPQPTDYEVLVKFHAASLNYRDLIIPKGPYLFLYCELQQDTPYRPLQFNAALPR
jgi:NADPH:quinone reductase-like Zn-dependent oxidoreductase